MVVRWRERKHFLELTDLAQVCHRPGLRRIETPSSSPCHLSPGPGNTNSLATPPTTKDHFSGRDERCLPSASGTPREQTARDRTRTFPCTRLAKLPEPPPPPPPPVRSAYLAQRRPCLAPRGPRRNRKPAYALTPLAGGKQGGDRRKGPAEGRLSGESRKEDL